LVLNESFEFSALPTITSVSPSAGNIGGQYLTIKGNGFSLNLKNNTVTVDGTSCKITSSANGQINCVLNPKSATITKLSTNSSSQQNGYFAGAGIQYARYTVTSSIDSISKLVAAYRSSNTAALGSPQ
jgi:hypothetical protein